MANFETVVETAVETKQNIGKVAYFVVCDKSQAKLGGKPVYELELLGEKIVDWVARACENARVLEVFENENGFKAVLPYLDDSEYTVVLNGNIPLVTKKLLKNILEFVDYKNLNVCKLAGGIIFKTDYIKEVGEVFSGNVYDFNKSEFLAVDSYENFLKAKLEAKRRLLKFYSKNDVFVESDACEISARAVVNKQCTICDKTSLLGETVLGENCFVSKNCYIENSVIGKNVVLGDGAYIVNCQIADGVKIGSGCKLKNTKIAQNVEIADFCDIISSEFGKNSKCGSLARLYRAVIEEDYEVYDGKVIIHRSEDK